MSFTSFFDYTVNGLIIGNIYALLAVGLALIFGVSHLINFAHGSVYTVGRVHRLGLASPTCTRRCP
jgi:branched-chain amino acid transport system permease protein